MKTFKKSVALLLSILMVFSVIGATAMTASAEEAFALKTVYFDNSIAKWDAVYVYGWGYGLDSSTAYAMTQVEGTDYWTYELPEAIPAGTDTFLFKNTETDWVKQTDNAVVVDGCDCYRLNGETKPADGTWYVYGTEAPEVTVPTQPSETESSETEAVVIDFYVVAGDEALCGSAWNPGDKNNELVLNAETGLYEKTYTNVAAGTYKFKVTANGGWDNADFNLEGDAKYGGADAVITVTEDNSTVVIACDGTKAIATINGVTVEAPTQPTTDPEDTNNTDNTDETVDYSIDITNPAFFFVVAGAPELCGSTWDPADRENNELIYCAERGLCQKYYYNVPAGRYEFKITTCGGWDNADYNLEGDAKFGGANAYVEVAQEGSTVVISFDGSKAITAVYAPGEEYPEEPVATTAPTTESSETESKETESSETESSETESSETESSETESTAPSTGETETTEPSTDETEDTQPATKAPSLKKTSVSLKAGKTYKIAVKNSNGAKVTYSSDKKKIATVDKKGNVTALQKGTAKITVKVGSKKLTCKVKVTSSPKLSKKAVKIKKGQTVTLKLTGKASAIKNSYKNAKTAKITSKTNATKIKIKGVKKGTSTVKVIVNKVVTLKVKVTVK